MDLAQRPGRAIGIPENTGNRSPIIKKTLESPFEAVVQNTYKGVITETNRMITGFLQDFCQVRAFSREALMGLSYLVRCRV